MFIDLMANQGFTLQRSAMSCEMNKSNHSCRSAGARNLIRLTDSINIRSLRDWGDRLVRGLLKKRGCDLALRLILLSRCLRDRLCGSAQPVFEARLAELRAIARNK